jgi:oxalate decarboxylase/phosphoglucose isomerase-like protein (cupin superfamily)
MNGDVGYFPQSNSHYIENTGSNDLIFLEVLQADHFSGEFSLIIDLNPRSHADFDAKDISLAQWVGSTSKQIIQDTLNLSNETLSKLSTEKKTVVL